MEVVNATCVLQVEPAIYGGLCVCVCTSMPYVEHCKVKDSITSYADLGMTSCRKKQRGRIGGGLPHFDSPACIHNNTQRWKSDEKGKA